MVTLCKIKGCLNKFIYDPADVYDANKLLFFMSQIFGLISYRLHRNNGVNEYKICYIFVIINIIIILLFLSAFIFLTIKFIPLIEYIADFNMMEIYANYLQYILATIEVIAGCFVTTFIIRMFKCVTELDDNFKEINIRISHK